MAKNINRLRILRAEHGNKSQLDTALAVGIKQYRYWRLENGYDIPTPDERRGLAQFFGVEESEVFQESKAVAS